MLTPPAALHALLFAASGPHEKKKLAELMHLDSEGFTLVLGALDTLLKNSGVALVQTENEVELRTSAEATPIIKQMRESELARDLGKASLETLAVVAYQEGATRGEVDWVRGVNSSASLRTLLMRGLIEGREDEKDKRRIRYSLTTDALAHLGITRASELPRAEELRPQAAAFIEHEETEAAQ